MRKLHIAVGGSRTTKVWKNTELKWSALVERLRTTTRTPESQGEYRNMTKAQQDSIKDIGGFVGGRLIDGRRKAETVDFRDVITLDADFADEDFCDQMALFASYAWCVYSTHKHTPEKPRLRLLIPLDRGVSPEEYEAIARKIAEGIGIDQFDDTTYQPHRLMYWPSTSFDGEFLFQEADGAFLSADEVLAKYVDWHDVTAWPTSGRTVKKHAALLKKQEEPAGKRGLVGAFCRTYNVVEAMDKFLPGVYLPCAADDRFTYVSGSTAAGAIVYDDGKFLYSNHATDPASGTLCNAFDLVRIHKFGDEDEEATPGTPTVKLPSYIAMSALAAQDKDVRLLLQRERTEEALRDFGVSDTPVPKEGTEGIEDNSWTALMDVNKKGDLLATINNVKLILTNDIRLKGKLKRNDFTKKYRLFGKMPWDTETKERDWTDTDDAGLRLYIEKVYGIKGKSVIEDAWALVANDNRYHPVMDYLNGLTWDGIPRLETLFIDYLGAEDNEYTREVTKKSLVAAIARVFVPGIKYDTALVLVGPQGCGKSQILKLLGRDWFSDSIFAMQGREAFEQIQGFWIVEIGELAAMKRYEVETIKNFMSKSEDAYRAAYARHVETYKRQCVFFGTTNNYDFLKDMTGNRRFWPVDVYPNRATKNMWNSLDDTEIGQIWAEAVELWKKRESLHLENPSIKRMAEEEQERHLEESPLAGIVVSYLNKPLPDDWENMDLFARRGYVQGTGFDLDVKAEKRREKVCALEVWCEMLNGDKKDLTRQKSKEINEIILKTGEWEKSKTAIRFESMYGTQKGFLRIL